MANVRVERWRQVYAPNPAMLRLQLEREGYRVYHWVDRPGAIYGLHKHDSEQSHWVVSGELKISFATGKSYTLKTGDRDFLPAQMWHTLVVSGEEPVSYLVGEKIIAEKVKRKRGRPKKL